MKRATALTLILLCLTAAWAQEDVAIDEPAPDEPPAPTPSPPPASPPEAPSISVGSAAYKHLGADGGELASGSGGFGGTLFSALRLDASQSLEIQFDATLSGAPAKLQQAVLLLTAPSGAAAYAVAKQKQGHYTATVTPALLQKQLTKLGGELGVALLLGDPSAPAGVRWELGSLDLGPGPAGAPKALTATLQKLSVANAPIAHAFRPPAQHPPAVVSLAFTALAVAPLAVVLILLVQLGANFKGLPSGAATLWVLLFHGGIAAMLGLYLLFWVSLNLAQTLLLALLLGAFVAAAGYKALSAVADLRLAAAKKTLLEGKKTN